MAEIETPELDQQLQQAQADLKTAQANLSMAAITSRRWQNLLAKDAVSKQETDQAMSDLEARQSAVNASEANVRRLQQLQGFEKVIAPFDGIVTARNTDIGALVEAGANSGPKELFHLAAVNRLRVYIAVPEAYANAVANGGKVTLTETDRPDETFQGTLVRNSNAIDPESRTLTAEAMSITPTVICCRSVCLRAPATARQSAFGHAALERASLPCGRASRGRRTAGSYCSRSHFHRP